MRLDLSIASYEFEGVDGEICAFSGCSLAGKFEFDRRLQELNDHLQSLHPDEDLSIAYFKDKRLRWLINRLLKLNGIPIEACNWSIVQQLLLCRFDDDGEVQPGWLIEINTIKPKGRPSSKAQSVEDEDAGLEDLIAIAAELNGMDAALTMAEEIPAQSFLNLIHAQAELKKTPEQKAEEKYDEWKDRRRELMRQRAEAARKQG